MSFQDQLCLAADAGSAAGEKILAAARLSGISVKLTASNQQTPCGLPVPELQLPNGNKVRHTNAILRRVAHVTECGLLGNSFVEEGQVDSWLEWIVLEVDHQLLDGGSCDSILQTMETYLKTRTFIVGQRMTLADISMACSLRRTLEQTGVDETRKLYPNTVRWFLTCVHHMGQPASNESVKEAVAAKQDKSGSKSQNAPKAVPKAQAASASPVVSADVEAKEGNSKKEDKKKAKEAEKKAKEEEKQKREEEQRLAADAKHKGPDLTLKNFMEYTFGNVFIQSQCKTDRIWIDVGALKASEKDKQVWIRARVHNSRKQGNKLCFLTLRQDVATLQAVVFGPEMAGYAGALPDESVVDIFGKVACPDAPIQSCTQSDVELAVERVYCIGRSQTLPLQLADASRSEADFEKDPSLVRVGQDVRLDNRVIDLRTVANQAIFRIQSGVCMLFREFLLQHSFQEIHTPKLIGGASEGGADVFRVDYFEGSAFLAQSPQLYKQMALMTDMPRVFEIGPIFRSEKSFTHRHMTEFTGLDIEMTFKDHYHEVLEVLDGLFNHIFTGLTQRFSREIEAVKTQYPLEDLKWKHPCLRLKFSEAIALLRKKGPAILEQRLKTAENDYEANIIKRHLESVKAHQEEDDISTEDEKILGKIIHEEYGEDLYIIDKFPKDVRPFYTMPDPDDAKWTNAYDVFLRGEEITSGAQRIHDPAMLKEKAEALGIAPASIQSYIDAFKYGSYPHAGAGIGMERVVMLFLNLNNIRKSSMFPRDPKRITP